MSRERVLSDGVLARTNRTNSRYQPSRATTSHTADSSTLSRVGRSPMFCKCDALSVTNWPVYVSGTSDCTKLAVTWNNRLEYSFCKCSRRDLRSWSWDDSPAV